MPQRHKHLTLAIQMATQKSFRVGIRRKVPYLTNLFLLICGLCFLAVIVFDLLFSPFVRAGLEVQAAAFHWLVPESWKNVLIFSVIGFCLTAVGYGLLRYYKAAILMFYDNEIVIRGKAIKLTIPIKTIRRIYCNDAKTVNGEPKERLSITIELKRKRNATAIRLKNYYEADEFIEHLIKYENIDVKFYDFSINPTHMGEK